MTLVADFNSSVNVPFQRMRQQQLDGSLQEGVVGASDLMVVQRGAGVNQSVDVGAGFAWVQLDTGTRNGMGHVTNDATANVTVTAANGTNPRIDQIVLRWNDSSIPTGAGNVPTLEVLTGTATAGATLANRTGAAALPNDCLRLADLLIPTSSTTISNTQIRDRRPWARGASKSFIGGGGGNIGTSSTTPVTFSAGAFDIRLECSGVPMDIQFGAAVSHTVANGDVAVLLLMDGATIQANQIKMPTAGGTSQLYLDRAFIPAAGSHLFTWQWNIVTAGTGTVFNSGNILPVARFCERVRQDVANNTTTSG